MDVLRLMQVSVGRICEVCEILLESFGLGEVAWKYNKLARLKDARRQNFDNLLNIQVRCYGG